jgi:hypothetical protein
MPDETQTFFEPFLLHFRIFVPDTVVAFSFLQEPPTEAAFATIDPEKIRLTPSAKAKSDFLPNVDLTAPPFS